MKIIIQALAISGLVLMFSCHNKGNDQENHGADTIVYLKNSGAQIGISLWGGALADFHLPEDSINPFTWSLKSEEMPKNNQNGAPFQGHFLCTGRWGSPTPGEIKSGIPHNGEPSNVWWQIKESSDHTLRMHCTAPLEGFEIERNVVLADEASYFEVSEIFTNKLNIARNLPIVQHATIASPFLDTMVVLHSNAGKGFNQKFVPGQFLEYESEWPFLTSDTLGNAIDLTRSNHQEGFVGTFAFNDSTGWVTAYNPKYRLLLGYVWKTKDYPWLHIWHGTKEGKLIAKGLEFGTTGLGDTSPLQQRFLLDFYGNTNLNYIDANSSVEKKYVCFLVKTEKDVKEIQEVLYTPGNLTIKYTAQNLDRAETIRLK